jgi:hypothetical protein
MAPHIPSDRPIVTEIGSISVWSRILLVVYHRALWVSIVVVCLFISIVIPDKLVNIVVGHNDSMYFDGTYAVEQLAINGQGVDFRWTNALSVIRFPQLIGGMKIISLTLLNGSPDIHMIENIQVYLTSSKIATQLTVNHTIRQYHLLVLNQFQWSWSVPFKISSAVWNSINDPRMLGVMILGANLQVISPIIPVISLYTILCIVSIAGLLGVFAILMRIPPVVSVWLISSVNVLIALCLWWRPYEVMQFLFWGVAWLLVGVASIGIAYLIGIVQPNWSMRGVDLPVWCGVVWWSLPMIQVLLKADHILIPLMTYTQWMGVLLGGLLVSGRVIVWVLRRNRQHQLAQSIASWYGIITMAIMSFVHQVVVLPRVFQYGSGDFSIWLNAARRWIYTDVLYQVKVVTDNPFAVYKRPPFYILLFTPFIALSDMTVLNYFRLANIGLLVATFVIWMVIIKPTARWWWLATLVFVLNYQPLYDSITFGQTDVVLLFGFTVVFWCTRRDRDGWAGIVLAFLVSLKIYPIIVLMFFVVKRRWWALVGFVCGMVLWNGWAILASDWYTSILYVQTILPSIGGTTSWIDNQTIAGFLTRFYDTPYEMQRFGIPQVEHIASYLSMVVSAGVCIIALREFPRDSSAYALQYGLFMILMVVAIPVAWIHYTTLLIMVFIMLWWHYHDRLLPYGVFGAAGMSYALIAFGNYKSFGYPEYYGFITLLMMSYKFYGIVLLTGLIVYELLHNEAAWAPRWRHDIGRWWSIIWRRHSVSVDEVI